MAAFIDTGVFLALYDLDDRYHKRAVELIKSALTGSFGRLFTSDYVVDEAVTTLLVRTRHEIAAELGKYLVESPRVTKQFVGAEVFMAAWAKFKNLKDKRLSFTDCTSLAIAEKHGISRIMSFDSGFDGLITRIC
jgi:predicted nucleic acid-binding protein